MARRRRLRKRDRTTGLGSAPSTPTPEVQVGVSSPVPQNTLSANVFDTTTKSSTQAIAPEGAGSDLDTVVKLGKGAGALATGVATGAASPIDTAGHLKEGFITGTPTAVSGLQRGLGRLVRAAGTGAGKLQESANLIGQLGEILTKGRVQAPKADTTIFQHVSDALEAKAGENSALAKTIASLEPVTDDERTLTEKLKDPEFIYRDLIGKNAPNLAISTIPALATGGVGGVAFGTGVGFSTAATLEGGNAINEAIDFLEASEDPELNALAKDEDFTNKIGLSVGIVNGILETLPVTKLLGDTAVGSGVRNRILRDVTKKVVVQMAAESSTESVQEIVANSVARIYDEERDIFEGVLEAGIAGGLLGGGTSAAAQATQGFIETSREIPGKQRGAIKNPLFESDEALPEVDTRAIEKTKEDIAEAFSEVEGLLSIASPGGTLITSEETGSGVTRAAGVWPAFFSKEQRNTEHLVLAQELLEGKEPKTPKQKALYQNMLNYVAERVGRERFVDAEYTQLLETMEQEISAERSAFGQRLVADLKKLRKPKTPTQIKKAVKKLTSDPSPIYKRRETTLLKDRIRNVNRGFREGRTITKREVAGVQNAVIEAIDVLAPKDKQKFLKTIRNIQTAEQLQRKLGDIQARVDKLYQKAEAKKLKDAIVTTLKKSKARTVHGKKSGKFTPEVQEILDFMRQAVSLTREQAMERVFVNLSTSKDGIPSNKVLMENRILSMIIDTDAMSVAELQVLLGQIEELVNEGRVMHELRKFNLQSEQEAAKSMALDVITGGKGIKPGYESTGIQPESDSLTEKTKRFMRSTGKTIDSWNNIMDRLSAFDKQSAPGKSALSEFAKVESIKNNEKRGLRERMEEINLMVREAFNVTKDRDVERLLRDSQLRESLGIFTNLDGVEVELVMSRAEARKMWMEMKDPTLDETFEKGMLFTEAMKQAVDSFLTPQDKVFAQMQLDFYARYYGGINDVYKKIYGVNLAYNENYSPIKREGIDRDSSSGFGEFLQEQYIRRGVTNGSIKERVKNIRRLELQSDTQVLETHISDMEHFKAWAEKMRMFNAVFGDHKIRAAIEQSHDKGLLNVIDSFMNDFTRGGVNNSRNITAIDKLRGNFTRAVLAGKGSIGIKQLVSTFAYAEEIPVASFAKGTAEFWTNPVKNAKFMFENSELLRARGQNMDRDVRVAMKSDAYANFKKSPSFLNKLMLNVQLGDQGAIVVGGFAHYKYYRSQGMSHEDAIAAFEDFTSSTQQSSDLDQLSYMQRGGTFAKLFTVFLSAPNAYFRKEMAAVRNTLHGRGTKTQHAKTIAIYHFLLPMVFQFVSDLGKWDPEEQKRAAILGSLNGWFVVGDGLDYLIRKSLGMRTFDSEIALYSIFDDVGKAMALLNDDDITEEDWLNAMRGLAGATGSLTGTPLKQTIDISGGAAKILNGDFDSGFAQFFGWSPYISEKRFEEEERSRSRTRTRERTRERTRSRERTRTRTRER